MPLTTGLRRKIARFKDRIRRLRRPRERLARPKRRRVTFGDVIDYLSVAYFGKYAKGLVKTFELERAIKQSGLNYYPELYAARVLAITTSIAALAIYISLLTAFLPISLAAKLILIILILLSPAIAFGLMIGYPSMATGARRSGVETELPFFTAYLTTMARGGVDVSKVLERVANLKVFKAMREEARRVVRDVIVFGKDPLEALEHNALDHPSTLYRDFILGYVTTVRTGGDVLHYLEIRTQDIFARRTEELKTIAERMSMFTELYITIAVILTLVFYIFFTISAVFPAGGLGGTAQLALFTFVLLPTLTILILYMIHSAQPKTPIVYNLPYRFSIFYGLPLSLTVFVVFLYATNAISVFHGNYSVQAIQGMSLTVGATLVTISAPGLIVYEKEKRKNKGVDRATANFLRDLAEVRKTGLSPEKSIVMLAERDYGPLTKIIRRIAVAINIGLDLEKAMRRALRGMRNWILLANMRFLADGIEVGGGTSQTLDSLARYANSIVDLEEELRRRLRTFIMMPYFGAIMVSVASLLVLSFSIQTLGITGEQVAVGGGTHLTPQDIARVATMLSVGGIFNSWLMGFVAGKIQDSSIAGGFRHATILVIITLIATILVLGKITIGT
ncbi:MAG: type II secretion system F family protein [Desulfurococcales archaeon]|nr:type II secretion system F family protein [Desulfurococcales archaeon]